MYDFIVLGQKETDNYVIQDMREGMGGKCCCTRYTLTQLRDKGYSILGINQQIKGNLGVKDVKAYNVDGSLCQRNNTYPNVDDTKRSAITIEKGIKVSRAEAKQRKEAGKKRSQTVKQNKRDALVLQREQEKLLKEQEKEKKKEQALIEKCCKRRQKSKALFELNHIEKTAGEYQSKAEYSYKVYLYTPSSVTHFMHGLGHDYMSASWDDSDNARNLNECIKRNGYVTTEIISNYGLHNSDEYQVCAANIVSFEFNQQYEDYNIYAQFSGPLKKLTSLDCRHINEEDVRKGVEFGTTADGGSNLAGIRRYLVNLGYFGR